MPGTPPAIRNDDSPDVPGNVFPSHDLASREPLRCKGSRDATIRQIASLRCNDSREGGLYRNATKSNKGHACKTFSCRSNEDTYTHVSTRKPLQRKDVRDRC